MAINFLSTGELSIGDTPSTKIKLESNGSVTCSSTPVFYGELSGTPGSNYLPVLTGTARNITLDGASSKLTVEIAGYYHIHCQQLISASGQTYLHIRRNGVTVSYAYANGYTNYDMVAECIIFLQPNDYVQFYYSGTVTTAWSARHSSVSMHLIG